MFKYCLFISLLLFAKPLFSQTYNNPSVESKTEKNVFIKSVVTNNYNTTINFYFTNTTSSATTIWLNTPGHDDELYIYADGEYYSLISTSGIGNEDNKTSLDPNERIEFSAKFEKIPSGTTSFDLIEGENGTWNFYGVRLGNKKSSFSKTYSNPDINRQTQNDVHIKSVVINSFTTTINFYYENTQTNSQNIWLNDPGEDNAFYIYADGEYYSLISTSGIGNQDDKTSIAPNEKIEFSARFDRIPNNTTSFDLIEGDNGTWNFYGINLSDNEESSNSFNTVMFNQSGNWYNFYWLDGNVIKKSINGTWTNWLWIDDEYVKVAKNDKWVTRYQIDGDVIKMAPSGRWENTYWIKDNCIKIPLNGTWQNKYWLDRDQLKKAVDGKWIEFARPKGEVSLILLAIMMDDWDK